MCAASETTTIPLARVWAQISRTAVEVLWIDESSPYRRSMRCDRSEFSLDDWRGKAFSDAEAAAARCGVTLNKKEFPHNLDSLKRLLLKQVQEKTLRVVFIDEDNKVLPYVSLKTVNAIPSIQPPSPGES